MESELYLAVVGGRSRIMNWYAIGGYATREMEELVQMALGWKGYYESMTTAT